MVLFFLGKVANAVILKQFFFQRILKQCCYLYSSNLVKISIHEGVIVSCGMEVAYNNYLMFAASQDSLIIDRFVAYSWQKLSLLTVTK